MSYPQLSIFHFHKLLNLCELMISFLVWKITGIQMIRFCPVAVSIEPVDTCNLGCPECPTGNGDLTRKKEMLEEPLFQKMVDDVASSVFWTTLYFQGEPFLHPRFTEMIAYCNAQGLYTYTSTNAQLITGEIAKKTVEAGLDKIVISADGLTQEVYGQYRRGGDLQKVRQAIQSLVHWKKELNSRIPVIELQFIVMKHNEFQAEEVEKTGLAWGADLVKLKSARIDFERIDGMVPQNSKYARYVKDSEGAWIRKKRLRNDCWRQWSSAVIAVDGSVLPCCFDKNGEHAFGNIRQNTLFEIWNGENARNFRTLLRKNRKAIAICRNCSE